MDKEANYNNIIIEGDSKNIIMMLKTEAYDN